MAWHRPGCQLSGRASALPTGRQRGATVRCAVCRMHAFALRIAQATRTCTSSCVARAATAPRACHASQSRRERQAYRLVRRSASSDGTGPSRAHRPKLRFAHASPALATQAVACKPHQTDRRAVCASWLLRHATAACGPPRRRRRMTALAALGPNRSSVDSAFLFVCLFDCWCSQPTRQVIFDDCRVPI